MGSLFYLGGWKLGGSGGFPAEREGVVEGENRGLSQVLQTQREDFEERQKRKGGSAWFMPLCCHTAAVSAAKG